MKIENIIETCIECRNCRKFNDSTANFGNVLICTKSDRLIVRDKVKSHQSNLDAVDIPKWCELEDYLGDRDISDFNND